jgi:hypothetical protein
MGLARTSLRGTRTALHGEAEVHDVAVLDQVLLALDPQCSGVLRSQYGSGRSAFSVP